MNPQNQQNSLRRLYETGSSVFDLGDYDTFQEKMKKPESRQKFYSSLSQHYDLGDYKSFEGKVLGLLPSESPQQQYDDTWSGTGKRMLQGVASAAAAIPRGLNVGMAAIDVPISKISEAVGIKGERERGEKAYKYWAEKGKEVDKYLQGKLTERFGEIKPASPEQIGFEGLKPFEDPLGTANKLAKIFVENAPTTAMLGIGTMVNPVFGTAMLFGVEAGDAEQAFDELEAKGIKIDPSYRKAAATSVGALNAMLERVGFDQIFKSTKVPGLKSKLFQALIASTTEGATEALQEVNQIIAETGTQLSEDDLKTMRSTFEKIAGNIFENKKRVEEAGLGGAVVGGGISALSSGGIIKAKPAEPPKPKEEAKPAEPQAPPEPEIPKDLQDQLEKVSQELYQKKFSELGEEQQFAIAEELTKARAAANEKKFKEAVKRAVVPEEQKAKPAKETEQQFDAVSQEVYGKPFADITEEQQARITEEFDKAQKAEQDRKLKEVVRKTVAPKEPEAEKPKEEAKAEPAVEKPVEQPAAEAEVKPEEPAKEEKPPTAEEFKKAQAIFDKAVAKANEQRIAEQGTPKVGDKVKVKGRNTQYEVIGISESGNIRLRGPKKETFAVKPSKIDVGVKGGQALIDLQKQFVRAELEKAGISKTIIDELAEPRRSPRPFTEEGDFRELTTRKGRIERAVEPPAQVKGKVDEISEAAVDFRNKEAELEKAKADIIEEVKARGGEVVVDTETGAFTVKLQPGKTKMGISDTLALQKLRREAAEAGAYSLATVGRGFEIAAAPEKIADAAPLQGSFADKIKEFVRRNQAYKEAGKAFDKAKAAAHDDLVDAYLAERAAGREPQAFKGISKAGVAVEVLTRRNRSAIEPDIEAGGRDFPKEVAQMKQEAAKRGVKGESFLETRKAGAEKVARAEAEGTLIREEGAEYYPRNFDYQVIGENVEFGKSATYSGTKEIIASRRTNDSIEKAELIITKYKHSDTWSIVHAYYGPSKGVIGGVGHIKDLLASNITSLSEAKKKAINILGNAVGVKFGGQIVFKSSEEAAETLIREQAAEYTAIPNKIKVDGKERPTRNSKGQLIHPTREGIINFWKWFGDSKVVDEQGRPLVMYHGTNSSFEKFDKAKIGTTTDDGFLGKGFYFSTDPNVTRNKTVSMPTYLLSNNPAVEKLKKWEQDKKELFHGKVTSKHDSAILDYSPVGYNHKEIMVKEPAQIKSAIGNRGTFSPTEPSIVKEKTTEYTPGLPKAENLAPIFYSQLERVLETKIPNSGTPESFLQTVEAFQKKGEFKQEEINWIGLKEWLAEQNGKLTKQQVLEFVRENQVEIVDIEKGAQEIFRNKVFSLPGWNFMRDALRSNNSDTIDFVVSLKNIGLGDIRVTGKTNANSGGKGKFSVTYGNKKIVTGGTYDKVISKAKNYLVESELPKISGSPTEYNAASIEGNRDYREILLILPKNTYKSAHFKEQGIVAHTRIADRTINGKNTLYIYEIQSDLHQYAKAFEKLTGKSGYGAESNTPDTPFKKSWHELVLKRLIRYAVDRGYDKVAITNGDLATARASVFIGDKSGAFMHKFYDEIVPSFAKNYIKKWGGTVKDESLGLKPIFRDGKVLSDIVKVFDITPAMRESVRQSGQVLFEKQEPYNAKYPKRKDASVKTNILASQAVNAISHNRRRGRVLLANAINAEAREKGTVSLIGKEVRTSDDVAVLAQVYRDPRWETLRYIFVKNGKIVHVTGVSNRLPAATAVFPVANEKKGIAWLNDLMKSTKADGYYILHNHPSGKPNPSPEDINMTKSLLGKVNGFKGHVIIDSNNYTVLVQPGDIGKLAKTTSGELNIGYNDDNIVEIRRFRFFGEERLLAPSTHGQANESLGLPIRNMIDIAEVGKRFKKEKGWAVLISSSKVGVRGIMEVDENLLQDKKRTPALLRKFARQTGAPSVFAYVSDEFFHRNHPRMAKAITEGFVVDVVSESGYSALDVLYIPNKRAEFGIREFVGREVKEGSAIPDNITVDGKERSTRNSKGQLIHPTLEGIENFWKWFGDSKITDKQGRPLVVYHQTSKANEREIKQRGFDISPEKARARLSDDRVPNGVFFKPDEKDIGLGSKKASDISQIPNYISISNPVTVPNTDALLSEISRIDDELGYKLYLAQRKTTNDDKQWAKEFDERDRTKRDEYLEWADDYLDKWQKNNEKNAGHARELIDLFLEKHKYDGIVIERDIGSFGRQTKTYIAIKPTQAKHSIENIGTFSPTEPSIIREDVSQYRNLIATAADKTQREQMAKDDEAVRKIEKCR